MLDEVGCDAVMIGRAALGNPWILKQTVHYLETGNFWKNQRRIKNHRCKRTFAQAGSGQRRENGAERISFPGGVLFKGHPSFRKG